MEQPLHLSGSSYTVRLPPGNARGLASTGAFAGPLSQLLPARLLKRTWSHRFGAVVPASLLFLFDGQDDAEPKGVALLGRTTTVQALGDVQGGTNVLAITPYPGMQPILLSFATVHDSAAWLDAIMRSRSPDVAEMEKRSVEAELARVVSERDVLVRERDEHRTALEKARGTAAAAETWAAAASTAIARLRRCVNGLTSNDGVATVAVHSNDEDTPSSIEQLLEAITATEVAVATVKRERDDVIAASRAAAVRADAAISDSTARWSARDARWASAVQLLLARLSKEHERSRALAVAIGVAHADVAAARSEATRHERRYEQLAQVHRKCYSVARAAVALPSSGGLEQTQSQSLAEGASINTDDGLVQLQPPAPQSSVARQRSASFHAAGVGSSSNSSNSAQMTNTGAQGLSSSSAANELTTTSAACVSTSIATLAAPTQAQPANVAPAAEALPAPLMRQRSLSHTELALPRSTSVYSGPAVVFQPAALPPRPPGGGAQGAPTSLLMAPRTSTPLLSLMDAAHATSGLRVQSRVADGGRLHLLATVCRGVPASTWNGVLTFGARTAYLRMRPVAAAATPAVSEAAHECVGRAVVAYDGAPSAQGGDGAAIRHVTSLTLTAPAGQMAQAPGRLSLMFNQVFTFHGNSSIVRIELAAHRAMRSDAALGVAALDVAALASWPGQAHAVWLVMQTPPAAPSNTTASAATALVAPDPAEVLVPVGASNNEAATDSEGRWVSRELPPMPVEDSRPVLLLQAVYCERSDEVPRWYFPPVQRVSAAEPHHPLTAVPSLPDAATATSLPRLAIPAVPAQSATAGSSNLEPPRGDAVLDAAPMRSRIDAPGGKSQPSTSIAAADGAAADKRPESARRRLSSNFEVDTTPRLADDERIAVLRRKLEILRAAVLELRSEKAALTERISLLEHSVVAEAPPTHNVPDAIDVPQVADSASQPAATIIDAPPTEVPPLAPPN